jgi:hypothetical protein
VEVELKITTVEVEWKSKSIIAKKNYKNKRIYISE